MIRWSIIYIKCVCAEAMHAKAMNDMRRIFYLLAVTVIAVVSACRNDEVVIPPTPEDTGKPSVKGKVVGMYVLNEGNMTSNKATLDYLDLSADGPTAQYMRNIYPSRNPDDVKELGDVGNDVKIYGSKLWMVINCSNKVVVASVADCRRQGQVDIPNCRYLAFHDGYAYVSSYVGPVDRSQDSPLGSVYKVDTTSLSIVGRVDVGYQPDEMAVLDGKLYVANSGGYRAPDYDRTVSVIDLATFREERKIDVDINLFRCKADKYGQLWVSSRGDTYDVPSRLYWLRKDQSGRMEKAGSINHNVSDYCIVGDSLYFIAAEWSSITMDNTISYGIVNVRTHELVSQTLSSAPELAAVEMPYGIIVNPYERDFYVMDAKNYLSSGELLHFKADGSFDWKVSTGDIPGHAAFVFKDEKK